MSKNIISASDITMDFRGLRALNEVGFDVEEGSITAIIGPNGAGKSTLFNVIAGDLSPTRGQIAFGGQNISGKAPEEICRLGISRTYQTVRPFLGLSVRNNVRVALLFGRSSALETGDEEREVTQLLEFVHLEVSPEKKADALSPLERKRLELARALATDPKVLLLDEIIAGLSPNETLEMMETIRKINEKGVTVLLIEHVMKAVMGLSAHVIVLHHGEKIAEGEPEKITGDDQVISAYLGDALEREKVD